MLVQNESMKNCARKTDSGTKSCAYFCFGSLLPSERGAELITIVQQYSARARLASKLKLRKTNIFEWQHTSLFDVIGDWKEGGYTGGIRNKSPNCIMYWRLSTISNVLASHLKRVIVVSFMSLVV